ncbi:MAG: hypothetical protein ACYDHX_10440 [Methanothrix sp.]
MAIKEIIIEVKPEDKISCINCGYLRLIGETCPRSSGLPINEAGNDITHSIAYEYQWSLSLTGIDPDNPESPNDWVNKLSKIDYPILVQILFHNQNSGYAIRAISGTIKPPFMIKRNFKDFLRDGWAKLFGDTVKSFGEYSKFAPLERLGSAVSDASTQFEKDSMPSSYAYKWYSKLFTSFEEKQIDGVEWHISSRAFRNLGNQLIGAVGLIFIELSNQERKEFRLEPRAFIKFEKNSKNVGDVFLKISGESLNIEPIITPQIGEIVDY